MRHAKLLVTERTATRDALRDGLVSPEQAAVIVDAIEELPTSPHLRELAEKTLLGEAGRLHATDLAKAARHLLHVVDPDGAERKAQRDLDAQDRAAHLGRYLAITEDGAGGVRLRGRGTVEDAATIKAALLPLTKPAPAGSGAGDGDCGDGEDVRDHGARMWDAMMQTCAHALSTHLPPDAHGARPRVAVTLTLDALKGKIDWSPVTDDGTELSPGTARRLACDADVIPVVLGTRSEVLDVGRAHRLVTPALWRALVCRDRHCAFPGCTRPPVMGHAHHLRPLGRRRTHRAGQPGAALRAPPPHHPHHPLAGPAQPRRRQARVPAPTQTRQAPPRTRVDPATTPTGMMRGCPTDPFRAAARPAVIALQAGWDISRATVPRRSSPRTQRDDSAGPEPLS